LVYVKKDTVDKFKSVISSFIDLLKLTYSITSIWIVSKGNWHIWDIIWHIWTCLCSSI